MPDIPAHKKSSPLLYQISNRDLLFLFILNLNLAAVFEAPYVNLTQLLILPFLFLILISIYGFVKFRNQI